MLVGGPYSANGADDLSIRPVADAADIDHETASRMSVSFCVARGDCSKHIYDCNLVPMERGSGHGKADHLFNMLDQILHNFNQCNGKPPISCAWDGSTCNSKISKAFLGLLPKHQLRHHRFFSKCEVQRPKGIPFWSCGCLKYADKYYIFGNSDSLHQIKRLSIGAFTSGRSLTFGSVRLCSISHHLGQGPRRV